MREHLWHITPSTGKTKDRINARKDLTHPELREKINKTFIALALDEQNKVLPPAPYTLSKSEKKCSVKPCKMLKFLMTIVLILEILFQWMIVVFTGLSLMIVIP